MRRLWLVCGVVAAIGCGGGGGGGTGGTTGAGGAGACSRGNEGCDCYPNGTCNGSSLTCLSNLCVSVTGTAGTGGAAGTAGTTGAGGSLPGTAGTGGSGAGGTTGSGGSGACSTGNEGCACYGNGTCNGSLACLSQLCVSLTGTGGRGGTTGTAGTGGSGPAGTTGTGGRGGTTGTAGTGGSASNGALQFTAGVLTAGSNTFGIAGGVYTFTDGVGSMITPNCATDDCFGSVTGTGPICVNGIGTRVLPNTAGTDYDYATYWGAALGMDLNNPTNTANGQLPYKASDYGVKGFQFTFQNRGTSVVRLTFKVRDTAGTLVDYCLDLGTATSSIHFSAARQACYAAVPGPALSATLADRIEQLQWQVPTTPAGSVAFDYCISNIIPLLQ